MPSARTILPERIDGPDGLVLRRWVADDAEALGQAVAESAAHLRPWMGWIADEPMALDQRRALIGEWERAWSAGGDVILGVFLDGEIVGGGGLHRRIARDGLEIGYWTHSDFLRRGLATRASALLTGAAFALPRITHVEIHHDKANEASAGVPRKLGFAFLGETPDEPVAPAEIGVECRWRMEKLDWCDRAGIR